MAIKNHMEKKAKAPTAAAVGALKIAQNRRNLNDKSTTGEAQRQRILRALLEGPKTSYELRCLGCYQAPARIKELRDNYGHKITTTRVTLVDRDGYSHPGAGLYTLEVDGGQQ